MSSYNNSNYDDDFELDDQEYARRQQLLQRNQKSAYNISDEDEVEEEQSSTTGDEESSIASIAKAAAFLAPNHHLGDSITAQPVTTTAHLEDHSFSEELKKQEEEEEKKLHQQHYVGHHDDAEEVEGDEEEESSGSAAKVEGKEAADNLDDSLNDQVKEMYDYFKEHVAADAGNTEEESGAESSLNASGAIGESSGNQQHLATIMGDVLRVNNAMVNAAQRDAHEHESHHDEDGYDKIERSEVKMIHEEDELDKSAEDSLSSSHGHDQHHAKEHDHDHDHDHETSNLNKSVDSLSSSSHDHELRKEADHHDYQEKIDSLASSHREEAESDLDRSVTDALRVAARIVDLGESVSAADELNASADSSHLAKSHESHESHASASAPAAENNGPNKYDLSDQQINDVVEFYNKVKVNELLSRKLLRPLFSDALAAREDLLTASESDLDRALEAVDRDQDDKITLDEFIELLLLFFSSKHNLSERLESVLRTRAATGGDFTPNDAIEWTSFLNDFYGKSNTHEDLFNTLDLNLSLQPDKLVSQLAPKLESAAFVNWERKRERQQHDHEHELEDTSA